MPSKTKEINEEKFKKNVTSKKDYKIKIYSSKKLCKNKFSSNRLKKQNYCKS